jgi:hypothetical protein
VRQWPPTAPGFATDWLFEDCKRSTFVPGWSGGSDSRFKLWWAFLFFTISLFHSHMCLPTLAIRQVSDWWRLGEPFRFLFRAML